MYRRWSLKNHVHLFIVRCKKRKSKPSLQLICIVLTYLTLMWSGKETIVSLILDFMCLFCFDVSVRVDCDSQQCRSVRLFDCLLEEMLVHLKAFFASEVCVFVYFGSLLSDWICKAIFGDYFVLIRRPLSFVPSQLLVHPPEQIPRIQRIIIWREGSLLT